MLFEGKLIQEAGAPGGTNSRVPDRLPTITDRLCPVKRAPLGRYSGSHCADLPLGQERRIENVHRLEMRIAGTARERLHLEQLGSGVDERRRAYPQVRLEA